MTGKGVMNMNHKPQEITETVDCSEDYPLGGFLEPYDIWRDIEMLENARRRLFSGKIRHLPSNSDG
jgi:hypothetical protein